jgi:hypothetical protein
MISDRHFDVLKKYVVVADFDLINSLYKRDVIEWLPDESRKSHQLQKLASAWNLIAVVGGFKPPAEWAKDSTPQTLELHMSLHPVVAGDCSIAIGVLKSLFDSDSWYEKVIMKQGIRLSTSFWFALDNVI